ncbi:hypothetical protein DV737_g4216, partial [Chaetothyriales sp. CBS 132003]
MAYPPSSYGNRGPSRGLSRSFTVPHRQLSVHERAGLDQSDAEAGILYTHGGVRIFSFEPPPESINSKSSATNPDADYPIDTIETLPWRSRTECLVACGALLIEKVRGSVPCFKCGPDFVHPIVRNSQCWCVDGESKFVLRRGKLQYYRFELPTATAEEQKQVEELKTVLAKVLKYEITPCPFKRAFHVELPDDAIVPRRKGKWKRREGSLPLTAETPVRPLRRSEPGRSWRVPSHDPVPTAEMPAARRGSDYGFVQTPRHASLRTSYLADRPETPSSMASSEEWERRRMEEDSDDVSSEANEQEEHVAPLEQVAHPVLVAKESPEMQESTVARVESDFKILDVELPPIAAQPTPAATANDDGCHEPDSEFEPEPRAEQEPEAETEQEPEAETEQEPEAETEQEPEAEAEKEPEAETEREPEAEAEQEPEAEAEQEPEAEAEQEPEAEAEQEPEAETEQEPEAEAQPEPEDETEPEPEDETEPEPEPEPEPVSTKPFIMDNQPAANPDDYTSLEQADLDDRGPYPAPAEEDDGSETEDQGVAMNDMDNDDVLLNIADIPEGTFLPSTPELHYLEEHADLLEEHGFSDEELEPLALAAGHPVRTVDIYLSDPVSSPPPMNHRDSESVASTSASFHTADSEGIASDEEEGNLSSMDLVSKAGGNECLGAHSRQHRRDVSEMTVTASTLPGSLEPRSTSAGRPQSSASNEEWPEPASSSDIQEGIRRRVKSRRALSPLRPRPNGLGASNQHSGSGLASAIVLKVCRLAVVKPIEVLVLMAHVVVRIAGGATVNDLISGELFKLPAQGRRSTSFPDHVSRPQYEEEDEFGDNDDYDVPIRGRTKRYVTD